MEPTVSRKANMTHKKRNSRCEVLDVLLLGFSFYLEARHGGLSIKIFFFRKFYFLAAIFLNFGHQNLGLDPDLLKHLVPVQ